MAIRMSGLASGMDTDSIVQALMSAKKQKKTKIEAKKTKLEWTQTIWSSLNTKLNSFYKDYAGKLRFQANYGTKKATSSDSSKVTATAKNGATKGSHSIKVNRLAKAQKVTGSKLGKYTVTETDSSGATQTFQRDVSHSTKLKDLGMVSDGSSQIKVQAGSKTVSMTIDDKTTVSDFLKTLQDGGLNASYDANMGRFFISSKESGKSNGFTITSATLSTAQNNAQTALKNAVDYDNLDSTQRATVQSVLSDLQNSTDPGKVLAAETTLKALADEHAKTVITNHYQKNKTDEVTNRYLEDDGSGGKRLTAAGISALQTANMYDATEDTATQVSKVQGLITSEVSTYMSSMATQIENEVTNGLAAAGVDSKANRDIAISNTVAAYESAMVSGTVDDADASSALKTLGLGNIYNGTDVPENAAKDGMVVIAADDSEIQLDGVTLTGSSTTMEVDGMTLNLIGVTDANSEVTLTVENDTDAVYDTIKEFINQYNSILGEINKYYYASSAKDYDVLTDEEKEAMSDDEVEKWETKIKDSLLRRDSTLGSIADAMRNIMTGTTITASNGKKYSLANLGITTGTDYKEYGLLHIKGDEDDSEYSESTNTLMSLLSEDPDTVAEVLSGVTTKLYNTLQQKMRSTKLSSALTFYNDKEMNSQLSRYKDEISDWEKKLADLEERYYNQFTAMEKAMSTLNSQQNMFSQYLGG